MQVKSPILNFFFLVLRISLDFSLDADHKGGGFCKILPKKGFEFVSSKKDSTIAINLSLVLLLVEVDLILDE